MLFRSGNNKIRKITTTGVVSTFAGTGAQGVTNGTALSATFKNPMGIAIDASGTMYVADRQNYLVRKISAGTVSTLAGSGAAGSLNGTGTSASFNRPNAVAVDAAGNVYVADDNNMVIRKITPAGVVTILAGAAGTAGFVNGTGTAVRFNSPYGLSVDGAGNIYTADQNNYVIRKTVTKAYTISPKLPAGLTFNDATGTISGTPTALSAATNYQIQAFNTTHSSNVATISIAVTAASFSVILPSQDQNYVLTYTPRTELLTPAAVTAATSNRDKVQINIEYIDGLGRSLQQVEWQGSPNKRDLVTPIAYDAFGREDKKYLQYSATVATSIGSYKAAAITDQNSFYTTPGTTSGWASGGVVAIPGNAAVSKTIFEASPLSRVLEQGAPGAIYQPAASRTAAAGRTSVAEYKSNLATGVEAVKLWVLTANGASCGTNTYAVNKLYRTIAKDENWISGKIGTIEEYKDFGGKVVLKRVWETETASLSTYYVYDDFGNLRYVIPPAVTATAFTEVATDLPFNQFVYAYHYDTRHRLIEKKIPGKEWEYLVYNVLDQVVLTQDGVQRSKANQSWTATKYDVLGRVIMTGIHTYGATANLSYRAAIQTLVDAQSFQSENKVSTGIGYTEDRTYPKVALNPILSIQYYDDYTAPNMPYNQSTMYSQMTKGLPTASQVNVLGTANRLWMVNYYDNNGRIVKTYKQHYQSNAVNVANYDEVSNTYNFSGELVSGTRLHRNGGVTTTITNTYEYDHMGRKKLAKEKVNAGDEVVLSRLSYNEVGQLSKKELHSTDGGTTFLQNTQYAYHPRGWLKTGTSAQFSNRLKYEDGTVPQYNGNIANQEWGAAASLANVYTYSYDRLDRLLNGTSTGIVMSEVLSYDVMGNIKTMNRDAAAAASTYNYTGNRLTNITGGVLATGNYSYDVNGNATTDGRTGVVLTYNLLNLPATVTRTTPAPIVNLTYTYDATGNKLRKVSTGALASTRHYVDGIEYNGNTIETIRTEEGLVRNNAGVYSYEYNLTDHLGNVRYTFNQHPTTKAIQRLQADDYYVFGKRKVVSAGPNKYLYNGKEIQDELGEQYDYGARFYDPVIARFSTIDNSAEDYEEYSPYVYVGNNPIRRVDPDGNDWGDIVKGAFVAIVDNATGGSVNLRERVSYNDAKDFNRGQDVGDVTSVVVGGAEGVLGSQVAVGGVVVSVGSGGTLAVAGAPAAAGGVAMVSHGLAMASSGASNLANQKGRASEEPTRTKHTDNRHVDRTKYPDKSKYSKPNQVKKLENRTMKNPDQTKTQRNGRVVYEKDFGRKIGTKGETSQKVVVDPKKNKVVTSYPQNSANMETVYPQRNN